AKSALAAGTPAQGFNVDALLRGVGRAMTKSFLFESVSAHPSPRLTTALVSLPAGADAAPSKQLAPPLYPTKSTMLVAKLAEGQISGFSSRELVLTNPTLPPIASSGIEPTASGPGKSFDPPPPAAI